MDHPYGDKRFSSLPLPFPNQYWQPPKFTTESMSHYTELCGKLAPAMGHPLAPDWHMEAYSPLRLPHVPISKPVESYEPLDLDSYTKLAPPDYPDHTDPESAVLQPEEETRDKPTVKKQTHQAIRDALSKRGITLTTLERPWETVRRSSLEGASTSQSSPGSVNGSPVESSEQLSDSEAECHKKRPQMSYMQLIQMALNSVPEKRMNLQQIYTWIELHFPFFKLHARKGWKNSVRHNLSLYDIFVREKPDPNDEWKFSYWCLRPENAANGVPNSASKRDADRAEKAGIDGKKTPVIVRGQANVTGMPRVNDYVVAVPPSMQQSGSRPLLPRSSNDTLAVIPLDYLYQLPPSQTGNFVCAAATTVPNPNYTGSHYDSTHSGSSQSDSGYISLNGSVLPVFPGQSFSSEPYKLPDNIPKPRNIVKEALKRSSSDGSPKKARKSRKSLPTGLERPKKPKKRTKSEPIELESKENVFTPLELTDHVATDLEDNFSSPLRLLLQSPPQGNFTSTPFKDKPLSSLRVTPIKNVPKKQQSTPKTMPWDCAFFSPGGKRDSGDVSILSNRSFNLSIPGLTPLKDKDIHDTGNVSMNDSLGRLLSDFQYDDNLLDCGVLPIDMDMANTSFLGMATPTRHHGSPSAGTSSETRTLQQL